MIDTGESLDQRKDRTKKILAKLRKKYANVTCALHHESALQLLIATILSAQSTDEMINKITPNLYKKYKTAADFANAKTETLENDIRQSGFFRQKTKSIKGACKLLVEEYDGEVPDTMEDLVRLPGVARKTANVILGTWFEKNEGIVVDTHVGRLAERMALTWNARNSKDAIKIEKDLMQIVPKRSWTFFAHALVHHGRQICKARKPECPDCPLAPHCPSAEAET